LLTHERLLKEALALLPSSEELTLQAVRLFLERGRETKARRPERGSTRLLLRSERNCSG